MKDIASVLYSLSKSKFRSSFYLNKKMIDYIDTKGMDTVYRHAVDFINSKLKPKNPINDGKQTPMKNHPVFIAQHATATCCRGCLEKWHGIKKNHELTDEEVDYILKIIMEWINKEYYGKM